MSNQPTGGHRPGYGALIDALVSLGVDTIFGVMGEGNLDLIAEWTSGRGLRYLPARHEAAAVAMATGYAHVTSRPGVCTVTHGPGLGNTVTALTSAVRARLPVLLIAGDLAADADPAHPQGIDQPALIAPTGATVVNLPTPAAAPAAARQALELLTTTGRPVVLNAPTDVQVAGWRHGCTPEPGATSPRQRGPAPAAELAAAAQLLATATFPAVLAGQGAYRAGAAPALVALAEHLGAPLTTSLKAKDLFGGHGLDVGTSGGFATPVARAVLAGSDCVLAVGASLNQWTTAHGRMFPKATVVHCDIDDAAIGPAALPLRGDADATARALLDAVAAISPPQPQRRQRREQEIAARRRAHERDTETSGLVGQQAMVQLNRLLPADRTVIVDGGHFMGYPATELAVGGPSNFLWTSHFGSIGLGLGTAIGAALGCAPEQVTVLVVGDGGLMMSMGELDTVARCGRPLVVVAMNDSAYGAEVHFLRHRGLPPDTAMFAPVKLAQVAGALGLPAFRVRDPGTDLAPAAAAVARREHPVFIEVEVSPDEVAPWFRNHLDRGH